MATGTGKTLQLFKLFGDYGNQEQKENFIFLADRNILVDQTMTNDFKPFCSKG